MVSGSIAIAGAYAIFLAVAISLFFLCALRQAALIGFFGGWLLLPVALYDPATISPDGFTYDVIGTALPSGLILTKALVVPLGVLAGLALAHPALVRAFRPSRLDLILAAFCLTPLLAFVAGRIGPGDAAIQIAYLALVWGGSWLIGRLALAGDGGEHAIAKAMTASGILLLPVALIEGLGSPQIYGHVFGDHPFSADGVQRYFGARPLALFEHGNQYGIWIAMAALAAQYLAVQRSDRSTAAIAIAVLLTIAAIASQSIGAIVLLVLGTILLRLSGRVRQGLIVAGGLLLVLGGGAYLSGKAPIERIAYSTAFGQSTMAAIKSAGRGSLTWRIHRDIEALETIRRAPLTGYGRWDWWRPLNGHPWGLPLLIAGQFGLVALGLAAFALLAGPAVQLWRGSGGLLPVVVLLSAVDAWLNSFIYFPALLAAAAIGSPYRRDRASGETPSLLRTESSHAH